MRTGRRIGWRIGLGTLALGAVVAIAAALALLLADDRSGATGTAAATPHRAAFAARRADALTRALRLGGAVAVSAGPGTVGAARRAVSDLGRPAPGDPVRRSRSFTVPRAAAAVRRQLLAHPPLGTRVRGRAGSTLQFAVSRPPSGIASERLSVHVLATGPHSTTVLAQARVVSLVRRAADERVPPATREIEIVRDRPRLALRVTEPARVAALVAIVDGLAAVQPGTYDCPADAVGLPRVRLEFRARPGGPVLAQASEDADVVEPTTACDPLRFAVDGRPMAPLLGGARLLRAASRMLGVRIWLAPYAA